MKHLVRMLRMMRMMRMGGGIVFAMLAGPFAAYRSNSASSASSRSRPAAVRAA